MHVEIWIGVVALFSVLALTGSVATLLYTQSLLKQCEDMIKFELFTDEEVLMWRIQQKLQQEQEIDHVELSD